MKKLQVGFDAMLRATLHLLHFISICLIVSIGTIHQL
jgi:hypothetical protein